MMERIAAASRVSRPRLQGVDRSESHKHLIQDDGGLRSYRYSDHYFPFADYPFAVTHCTVDFCTR